MQNLKGLAQLLFVCALLIGIGFLVGYCNRPDLPTDVPANDTTYVKGDTVFVKADTVWAIAWRWQPAKTDTVYIGDTLDIVKSTSKDTMLISNKDTIEVAVDVEYYMKADFFNILADIQHKDYYWGVTDTIKVKEYMPVEVEVTNPMWIITTVVAVLALLASIIFGG